MNVSKMILLIGISAQLSRSGKLLTPFDSSTPYGKFVALIEDKLPSCMFKKTNLVDFATLDKNGKVRYPTQKELFDSFLDVLKEIEELNSRAIVLFGNLVSDFFCKQVGLKKEKYTRLNYNNRNILCVDHPSYIMIYKRKRLDEYAQKIVDLLS